ncbi:major pollen allergen Ole e 10-like isoform X1 [Wolffia australiana]
MALKPGPALLLLLLSLATVELGATASPPPPVLRESNSSTPAQKTWCVAKPSTEAAALQENIDFACNHVDCAVLKTGYACASPSTLINHASVAMNIYYQAMGRNHWNCHFMNSGLIVQTDPSYGSCVYK